jgi:exodeoxyribonuclease V gamma subunit
MPLAVHFIQSLAEVVKPAADFLSRPSVDLFAKQRIVVPHAGAKAWLTAELAKELGARHHNGRTLGDGIVANVDISFPGTIMSLLQPPRDAAAADPWAFDRLTFAVLDVIMADTAQTLKIPFDVSREPLLAARRIAGLFDEYHVRRPGKIREWALGNAVLAPTANDEQKDDVAMAPSLRETDKWQFRVWRAVRERLGKDHLPPPLRQSVSHQPNHEPLLVAGLEALSLPQLMSLEQLAEACDVEAFVIHPSPGLRSVWHENGQQTLPEKLRDRPLQKRREPEFPAGVDPLLPMWLAGARELQDLLAARGTAVTTVEPQARQSQAETLLGRMQQTIAAGSNDESANHDPKTDRSVLIHRCHSLSRQAEVLHETLLQAFEEIEGLEPHEVAIVSPCIQKAAPHLEAVFQRTVIGRDASGTERRIKLPLVIADRGIRETSEAADLMLALLALPGSRGSIDDVLAVAGHPLVRTAFGVSDDTVATWTDFIERTAIRWGFDADHRARRGLKLGAHADIHTWKLGLERMLLGALLPAAEPQPEVGGVVPLDDLDLADLPAISRLARILDVIRTLEAASAERRSVAEWCDVIEEALVGLCGAESPQLAEPLALLRRLRHAARDTVAEKQPVPFHDVHELLATWLDEKAGRQPLRTGAITASSMVPLRGVPFKVVCVIGYDDGAVGAGEADGDDLVARQQLVGDGDPRADERRALLDCLLAADTRLIITCNGRNVKSNKPVPLVTPLAEFVDFAVRHGVVREKFDEASAIEIHHPRHHLSRRNFEEAGVEPAGIWSHDTVASGVLEQVEQKPPQAEERHEARGPQSLAGSKNAETAAEKPVIDLEMLELLVDDPLKLFLTKTLGVPAWQKNEESTPATLPTALKAWHLRDLVMELIPLASADPGAVGPWMETLRDRGVLPLGSMGEQQAAEICELAMGIAKQARESGVPVCDFSAVQMRVDLGKHIFASDIPGFHQESGKMVIVRAEPGDKTSYGFPLHVAAIRLVAAQVAAQAAGLPIPDQVSVVARHKDWTPGAMTDTGNPVKPCQIRKVRVDAGIDPRKRLALWCELASEAMHERRGEFGLRGKKSDTFEESFNDFVTAKNFSTGVARYPRTSEAIAYGLSPVFSDIFYDGSPERSFLTRFTSLFQIKTAGMTYTLV